MILDTNPRNWRIFAKVTTPPAEIAPTEPLKTPAAASVVASTQISPPHTITAKQEPTMSTAAVTPLATAAAATTATKTSFLQHVGSFFKKILHIGVEVATAAEPEVDLAFPDIAPIYNSAVGLATAAEATAATTTGTGAQKLAQLVTNLTPQLDAFLKTNGIVMTTTQVDAWASAVVDTINKIPAPSVAAGTGGIVSA